CRNRRSRITWQSSARPAWSRPPDAASGPTTDSRLIFRRRCAGSSRHSASGLLQSWRPVRGVIGQRRLLARLGERAVRGDVVHRYELSGPRSIGKHTLATRLAQTLNCATEPVVPGGCGVCLACRKIERGLHPDVREITRLVDQAKRDDRKNITIEQIRWMQQDLALRPLEGRKRVVIIDDAADLSEHAEVALLKTLEEPPPHAVLLLVTPTPSTLLETIRSRVQPLPFRLVGRAAPRRGGRRSGRLRARDASGAHGGVCKACRGRAGSRARRSRADLRALATRRHGDHGERADAPRAARPEAAVPA